MHNPLKYITFVTTLVLVLIAAAHVAAQSAQNAWQPPANVSQSGAASRPIIAAETNGSLHALWWDATEGAQYARATGPTATVWTRPIVMSDVVGSRRTDSQTGRIAITPPREIRLAATTLNDVHAFWINAEDRLFTAQTRDAGWSSSVALADRATVIDVASDFSGTLHLAYVRPLNTEAAPSGIYYRSTAEEQWSDSQLVYASAYVRSATPDQLHVSVAGNSQGQVIVVWDDPQLKQSTYVRSDDSGVTWSEAQGVAGAVTSLPRRANVASTASGEFLMIWQDSSLSGCGLVQRQSRDGGQSWSAPQQVLGRITRCAENWTFMPSDDGRLWLVGRGVSTDAVDAVNSVTIAAWDGTRWSEPGNASLSFYDSHTKRSVSLNCINVAIAGQTAGLVGCDANGDVWGTHSSTGLSSVVADLKSAWSSIETLSARTVVDDQEDLPALVSDNQGNVFALWRQPASSSEPDSALFASMWNSGRWSRPAQVLRSPALIAATNIARQPALAIDDLGKVHAVWNGGTNSPVFYSWAYTRDFASAPGWTKPVALPAAASISSRPSIAVDPAGSNLFVAYAVPFNEQRGIYLVRSIDGGSTWLTATVISDARAAHWDRVEKPQIAWAAGSKVLHAVWLRAVLPGSAGPQAIYYARSVDQGLTWSEYLKVAEGMVDWPRLAVDEANYVHLSWVQRSSLLSTDSPTPYGVWSAFSPDSGLRWSEPALVPGFQQVSGSNGLSANGAGNVYLAALGTGSGSEATLHYTRWTGQNWSEREDYGLGQPAELGNAVVLAAAPQAGRLNALLYIWAWQADGTSQFEVAGTNREIEVRPVTPRPTLTPLPKTTPGSTATPQPTPAVPQKFQGTVQQSRAEPPSLPPLALGGVLAAGIVVIAAARTIWVRRR